MGLMEYRKKRDFTRTREPAGKWAAPGKHLKFVVQKHDASHLHYDFRLEMDGVLKSWAIPKGPSLDPAQKRLAVQVEDHPLTYGDFEGTIPESEYGGGTVMVWDRGEWIPESDDPLRDLRNGGVKFRLKGRKLHGEWKLVRMRDERSKKKMWLLVKGKDEYSQSLSDADLLESEPLSVKSGRDLNVIAGRKKVSLTHPEKILYPKAKLRKIDLQQYLLKVSSKILEHISGRPLMLVRCPNGEGQPCFHQKHWTPGMPAGIDRIKVRGETEPMLGVSTAEGLVALAQIGTLEIHMWNTHFDHIDHPDQLVFDIDPAPGVSWKKVADTALRLRDRLKDLKLESFLKTTGGKGLHVVVPIEARLDWELAKEFSKAVCEELANDHPGQYLTKMSKEKRKGKIFLDYLRNAQGATAVAPFSPRARPDATVSVPLSWTQLGTGIRSDHFTIADAAAISKQKSWKNFYKLKQLPSR